MRVGDVVSFGGLLGKVVFIDPSERSVDVKISEKVIIDVPIEFLKVKKAGQGRCAGLFQVRKPRLP